MSPREQIRFDAVWRPSCGRAWLAGALSSALLTAIALALTALGCASSTRETARTTPSARSAPPLPAPAPESRGCVESESLKAYVAALEAQREAARAEALAQRGARRELRQGRFFDAPEGARVGAVYDVQGTRWALVAHHAEGFEPTVAVAKQGQQVRPLQERARAHAVPVRACGVMRCPARASGSTPSAVRPVVVALGPDESLGEPLSIDYDYWWAQVSQVEHVRCPEESPRARAAEG